MPDSSMDKVVIDLEALFKRADDVVATSVIGRPRRGSGYVPKVDAKIRLNAEVMEWLRAMGPRHYSRINGLLTALMEVEKASRPHKAADVVDSVEPSMESSESTAPENEAINSVVHHNNSQRPENPQPQAIVASSDEVEQAN